MDLSQKTFKRELSLVFSGLLLASIVKVMFFVDPAEIALYSGLIIGMLWPVLSFIAATAGLQIAKGKILPDVKK